MSAGCIIAVQATSKQIWAVVNFALTVVGGFVFGFFVSYYAGFTIPLVTYLQGKVILL